MATIGFDFFHVITEDNDTWAHTSLADSSALLKESIVTKIKFDGHCIMYNNVCYTKNRKVAYLLCIHYERTTI